VDCGRRAPLRRFKTQTVAQPVSPPIRCLPWGSRLLGVLLHPASRAYWFPTPASRFAVLQLRPAGLSLVAVPRFTCAKRVHPPTNFPPLQSSPVLRPPHTSRCEAPSLGLAFPLRGVSWANHCPKGSTPPDLSVLGVSHTFDGFRLSQPCGFISPHNHVQGSRFRGLSPLTQPSRLVDVPCPHAG